VSDFDPGDHSVVHDAPDAGHDGGHDDAIVAEHTDGSHVGVVDTNHDHYADHVDVVAVDRDGTPDTVHYTDPTHDPLGNASSVDPYASR
jgi:hypothetical protein